MLDAATSDNSNSGCHGKDEQTSSGLLKRKGKEQFSVVFYIKDAVKKLFRIYLKLNFDIF